MVSFQTHHFRTWTYGRIGLCAIIRSFSVWANFDFCVDHVLQLAVSKCEERKLIAQTEFETVCTKFWNLLKGQNPPDQNTITKEQYTTLLTRMYRVLAPLYRDEEMKHQVASEWIYDS